MGFPRLFRRTSVLLAAAAFTVVAQTPALQNSPGFVRRSPELHQAPQLTFNIVAQDAKGGPAADLRDTDLRIYDDGKLMHPAFCRPLETAGPAAQPGASEYSNRPIRGNSQTVLVLLDLLNENLAERGMGWYDVAHSFQKLDPTQHVYVYLLTAEGTLYPVHAMPAAGDLRPPDPDWAAKVPALLDRAMRNVTALKPQDLRANVDARVRKSLDLLKDVAADLGAQPGRKSLVWISHGVPISATSSADGIFGVPVFAARSADGNFRDYTTLVQDAGTSLAKAGITVYAVDQMQRNTDGLASLDTLQQLASLTGGQWLSSDRTEVAIQQALAEAAATYRVGYTPPLERWDNKFHKLRITVEGKGKSVWLRAPEGYFGDAREADPRDRFTMAAMGQSDDSSIGIRAVVTPSEKIAGWLHFEVRVDAADLQLTAGDVPAAEFGVTFVTYTTDWDKDLSPEARKSLRLTPETREAILREGVVVTFERPVSAGVHKMRVVVRDAQSGAVGSLTVPVVPPHAPLGPVNVDRSLTVTAPI
ncbi:MAG: VWA domain-containing protein [Bryobacteraceae bacterium]